MVSTPAASGALPRLGHALFVIQLISMGAMEMSGPFWPVHLQSLGASPGVLAFAGIAVYVGPMLGVALTSTFWGKVGDRFGHKPMMVRALLGLAITQLALAFTQDVWTILALRFLQGACAGYLAPAQAYGVSAVVPAVRGRLFAYLQVSTNVGSLAGALAGGLILDHATFFWINLIAALLCALCAVAVVALLPPRPFTGSALGVTALPSLPPLSGNAAPLQPSSWFASPVAGLLAVLGILLVARMLTQTPFAMYVRSVFAVDNWVVGLCYGLLSLGFIVSATLWARYFERLQRPDALVRMAWVAAACALLMVLAGATHSVAFFIALHFAWGVLLGATTPVLMAQISHATSGQHQGRILGVAQSTAQFSSMAGIALGGGLTQLLGLHTTYFLEAGAYACALAVIVAGLRMRGTRQGAAGLAGP